MSRRSWIVSLVMLVLVASASAAVPATASAMVGCIDPGFCQAMRDDRIAPDYKGWAFINANYCAPGMACLTIYRTSVRAWRWTGSSWSEDSIFNGARVYAWPAPWGGYHWVWQSGTGWLLTGSSRVVMSSPNAISAL